jgi:hypothetical protein
VSTAGKTIGQPEVAGLENFASQGAGENFQAPNKFLEKRKYLPDFSRGFYSTPKARKQLR